MIKLFISQPMSGKSEKEIREVKENAISEVKDYFPNDEIVVIDSYIKNAPDDAKPLWYLAQSILLLSTADVAYFAKGWRNARGCVIENQCATDYGLITIQTN